MLVNQPLIQQHNLPQHNIAYNRRYDQLQFTSMHGGELFLVRFIEKVTTFQLLRADGHHEQMSLHWCHHGKLAAVTCFIRRPLQLHPSLISHPEDWDVDANYLRRLFSSFCSVKRGLHLLS